MNRIWIVGAGGRVGASLTKLLNTLDNELFCTDIEAVDITDEESVEAYASMNRPNIIINCASVANEADCDNNVDLAYKINALGVRNLAVQAAKLRAKFVQMSTDDVYSGTSDELYNEFDIPHPTSIYGKSKYAGERMVSRNMGKFFIIRSSWVYGIGEDYVDQVCRKLENGETVEANKNEIAVPTSADMVAKVIEELIETEKYGIYHVVPSGRCTRYELACEIARLKGYPEDRIVPLDGPVHCTLLDGMMLRINDIESLGDWKEPLATYINETGGTV